MRPRTSRGAQYWRRRLCLGGRDPGYRDKVSQQIPGTQVLEDLTVPRSKDGAFSALAVFSRTSCNISVSFPGTQSFADALNDLSLLGQGEDLNQKWGPNPTLMQRLAIQAFNLLSNVESDVTKTAAELAGDIMSGAARGPEGFDQILDQVQSQTQAQLVQAGNQLPDLRKSVSEYVHQLVTRYDLDPKFRKSCPDLAVEFSGHSLGGALAEFADLDLKTELARLRKAAPSELPPGPPPNDPKITTVAFNALGAFNLVKNAAPANAAPGLPALTVQESAQILAAEASSGRNYCFPFDPACNPLVNGGSIIKTIPLSTSVYSYLDGTQNSSSLSKAMAFVENGIRFHKLQSFDTLFSSGKFHDFVPAEPLQCPLPLAITLTSLKTPPSQAVNPVSERANALRAN